MPITLAPEQLKTLGDLKMSYRVIHTANAGEDSSHFVVEVHLVDLVTGTVVEPPGGHARADTEQDAIALAIARAPTAERPMTPTQLAVENAAQRKRIEELEARLGKGQKPAPSKAGPAPTAG